MFITVEGKNGTQLRLKFIFLAILLFAILAFGAAVAVWGVWHSYQSKTASLVNAQTIEQWKTILLKQKADLAQIKKQANAINKSLARRIGKLQAGLLRLEALALSMQVADAVGKKELDVDFSVAFALGGPEGKEHTDAHFHNMMDDMSEELLRRQEQLTLLNELLHQRQQESNTIPLGRPVLRGKGWLSSKYGQRIDPFSGKVSTHKGVDFAGQINWPVVATGAGVVVYAEHRSNYGLLVEINHGNGYVTRYAHHAKLQVAAGDIVEAGALIGNMGNSGRSTGPHVHYEVLKDGKHINPKRLFERRL